MITLTQVAADQLKKIRNEGHTPETLLRVSVVGGGCSGLSYKLDFVPTANPEDKTFEQEGVKIVVDPKSFLFVKGLTLDYSGGLNGTGFAFQNPNAAKSCGCGTSFSV
jgi:iron-sulfur cluster assembly protein